MATKTLRVVRDSKYTGSFTRTQIDRAIRIVERDSTRGEYTREGRKDSSKSATKRGSDTKH